MDGEVIQIKYLIIYKYMGENKVYLWAPKA